MIYPVPRTPRLLSDWLMMHAIDPASASRPAVIVEGRTHTYEDLADAALRVAAALSKAGVVRGDRVAVFMDNTWACVVSIYAAMLAGGTFLVVNPQTKTDKLQFILKDCEAVALLTDTHLSQIYGPALAETSAVKIVIASGDNPVAPLETIARLQTFDEALKSEPLQQAGSSISVDLAALIYTSGSTGNPKGVMQTHQSMMFAAGSLTEYLRLDSTDRILCVLPLAFDYGLYQLLMSVSLGATLVLERSFIYPAVIFTRMQELRVTVFPGVPTIFAMLIASHGRTPLNFPEVRRITNTAAALPDAFVPPLREIFPNTLVYKMYGLTECKRVCYLEPELVDSKPGSVGKAIPGTEVYLLDENDQAVQRGSTGILHVRGAHVMAGYWNRPEQTEFMLKSGAIPGEKILNTHDLFRMDKEGFLYFVGRSDDIIKTRGEKVSPVEVENALHRIPGVQQAAVIGIPDDLLGEAVRAYIIAAPDSDLSDKKVKALSAALLENFMVPKEVVFVRDLPKTATGKVSKKLLREGN